MDPGTFIDPNLTQPDLLVLQDLLRDTDRHHAVGQSENGFGPESRKPGNDKKEVHNERRRSVPNGVDDSRAIRETKSTIQTLSALNDPSSKDFEPTVFVSWDLKDLKVPRLVNDHVLQPYISMARKAVRVETDVVMLTHLLLYLTTSVPSAIFLYYRFHWLHGVAHWIMQAYYAGTYTLMMHQHIHMGGVLAKKYWWIDNLFPYLTNPLMGHTWNSYYYHHVKHHHVEGNGPGDLSSTIYYQRDDIGAFLCYLGRFLLFTWLELPAYFIQKGQARFGIKAGSWEIGNYIAVYLLTQLHWKATLFVFILPFIQLRIALMVGNWGQHAFVDETEPDSDFRSSITLIDVISNRFSYNDGYHTSHHLNPRRHWRDHPVSFLKQKHNYSAEHALVFRNIDYLMVTLKLLQKDYPYLAKRLVPIGDQVGMSLDEIAKMLQTKTRRFTKAEIKEKFNQKDN